jgi:hypothetical protein
VNPIGAAFLINQTARAKFRNREKAGSLQICRLRGLITSGGHESIEGQTGKIVSRQEAFRGEMAIRKEVRAIARSSPLQQGDLLVRLELLDFRLLAFDCAETMHFRLFVRFDQLRSRTAIELPPSVECAGKSGERTGRRRKGETIVIGRPGAATGVSSASMLSRIRRIVETAVTLRSGRL